MKQMLSAEQSAELIKRGVSIDKARMVSMDFNGTYAYVCGGEAQTVRDCVNDKFYVEESMVFSLADLFDILPKLVPDSGGDFSYALKIQPCSMPGWTACYYAYSLDKGKGYHSAQELVDALYELLLWVIDNNYVKFD